MTLDTLPRPARPPRSALASVVDRLAAVLDRRTDRRGFLSRVAVVGSAVAVSPVGFAVRPGTAYASVCGTQSACSSGYTVFCATINNGVNRCPPNSLVGGWWKADGSSFCGGSARYYIDCHSYCSCGCGGGSRFCGEGCRSCSCGCGPGGQCDQRRVCCNNFRYGQCTRDVSCTGPVWCRVVTCTPPWKIPAWKCTTTSATDNRTATHSAPLVAGWTSIVRKYTELGGQGGKLGEPRSSEQTCADGVGRFTDYDGGGILSHPDHGTRAFYGAIRDRYYALGGERSKLGYPRSDEQRAPDGEGYWNAFVGGDIWWHPQHGAHDVYYAIRDAWYALDRERGRLGYPVAGERRGSVGDGYYNRFEGGDVYWHPDHGTCAVFSQIRDQYAALGREGGPLGYPRTGERRCADGEGRFNLFVGGDVYTHPRHGTNYVLGPLRQKYSALGRERGPLGYLRTDERRCRDGVGRFNLCVGGDIYSHPEHGTWALLGAIRDKYRDLDRERGVLGYPVTDERTTVRDGRYTNFHGKGEKASVYTSPTTGTWYVQGRVRSVWLGRGGPEGPLGFPVSDPYPLGDGRVRSDFEGGSLTYDPETRSVT